jgi:hypothetical protein
MSFDAKVLAEGNRIPYTPSGAVTVGTVVVLNSTMVAIATEALVANVLGSLMVRGVIRAKKVASGGVTFAQGAPVYWNASTGCTATTSDVYMGYAASAAVNATAYVDVVLCSLQAVAAEQIGLSKLSDVGTATATAGNLLIGDGTKFQAGKMLPVSLATTASAAAGVAIMLRTSCTADGAEDETVLAVATVKFRILDVQIIARDGTTTPTVTLKDGSNHAITDAMTKSGTLNTITRATKVIDSSNYNIVASGGSLVATFSGAGAVEVVVWGVVVA